MALHCVCLWELRLVRFPGTGVHHWGRQLPLAGGPVGRTYLTFTTPFASAAVCGTTRDSGRRTWCLRSPLGSRRQAVAALSFSKVRPAAVAFTKRNTAPQGSAAEGQTCQYGVL